MPVTININSSRIAARISAAGERAVAAVAQTVLDDINREYVPDDRGQLIASSETHSDIEHGTLVWAAPYARYLYHGVLMVDPQTKSAYAREGQTKVLASPEVRLKFYGQNPKAGSHWCERAYADKHEEWQEKYEAAFRRELNG